MSSKRKIDSARTNGAKSHGPVTEEGRKRSSMNALKHGLTAETVILVNEDEDEYNAVLEAYVHDLNPVGAVEMDLVVEMVNAKWRQRRLCLMESDLFDGQINSQKPELKKAYRSYTLATEHAYAFKTLTESGSLLSLSRLESRLERAYSHALKNLLQLQRLRKAGVPASSEPTAAKIKVKNEPNPTNGHHTVPGNDKPEMIDQTRETIIEPVLTSVLDTPPGAKIE